ncbi:MAG: amino acid adenylation domain-containing protein, partial [Pseudomonadota bacterium]|nr:amino acid adenylation domain-containing protein [Pseudomonadota bacterium]
MHTHNGLWAHFEASETSEIAIGQGLPLSAQQTGIWLHSQLADEQGLYNLVYLRRFEQPLDDDAAQDAVRAIVRRHPVLQVRFGVADGEIQQTCGEVSVPWTIVALDGLDQTGQESRLAECLDDAGTYSFDLASGPLLKVDHLVLGGRQSALILSVHHICFDGLSIAVFEQEFDALYEAFKNKQQCDLPLPSMSYFDYCHAQQAQLSGQEFQRQLDYWRGQLDGLPAVHSLPLKASRPTGQSHRGEMHSAVLELEVSQQLRTLAETLNASLFEVVHALFATLVARHGNCADVVIGVPFAKRLNADGSGAGLAQLIGMFAEPMVLRVDCHAALSFADLVAAVREASMGALANSDVPFAVLVKELHEERADRTSPLFQIMLNMVDGTMYGGEGGGFQIVPSDLAKYDLNLYVSDPGDGVIGFHFNYNADLFDADWIATLQAHLLRLVESAVADPVENIYKLAMLNTQERAQLLAHGRTPTALGQDFESLIAQFDAQVQRTPERVAVVDDAETLTFAELAVLVERTASAIRSFVPHACDGNEFLVALHGPRANSTIALMLGVLKAGGAFLCLDSQSPLARNREILEDAKPSLLICAHPTEWREVLPHGIALLDLQEALSSNEVCVARHRDARPDDLMYVVYTSGSTGRPKGVMVEHRQFAGFVPGFARQCRALGMDSLDAWLINQSFTFDPALIGLALLCGGTRVVILSDAQMKEPSEILRLVERHGIAVFKTSPSLAVALVECITRREHAPHLIVGGDDTSVDALEKLQRYCEQYGRKALNAYGPTETTINCAFSVLDGQVTIGRSMPGCTAYVLGEDMSLLPRGAVGELYVGGDCVARGYLGQPDLTRKAFVESPFEEERRRVLYRTGDYVRWLDDGRLQFRGRCDEQVKVRGYRVEVEEVAQTIRATQLVHDVRVVFNAERQQLVAFVIPIAGTSSAGSDPQALHERIRCALEERLPAYMHPALYASVEAWPTTRHGKLDRQALLKTETFHAGAGIRYPAGDLELKLADVWASLLGVPLSTITTDSCFFKLGGHSLLAIQLTSRLYELFGCMLQIRHIMERSRFSELADSIRSPSKGSIAAPIVPVTDACGRFPASFSQSKFWLVDNLSESGKRFNIVMRIGLPLDCDEGLVQQALDMVVGRHEALRTHFEYSDGLLQVVQAQGQCSLTTVDLRELDPQPRRKRLEAILADEYSLIRDLRTGPLIGATLIKEPQGSHLLINLHHIVSDAWSNELLAEEVRCCYRALSLNGPIELPVLSVQYRDYSAWQHNSLHERLPSLEAYWKQRLDGLPLVHELPLDFPRPVIQSSVGAYHSQRIGRDLQRSLSTLFLDQRATLFVGLQALFSAFLARWSGQADIALGTATANRNNPDTRYLIGAFVDTVVLRSDVQQERSFTEHLIATREASLADQDHFDMPFEVLVRTLNPERNGSYSPLFQLVLNLVYSSNDILMFDGDDRDDVRHPINVNYDLTLYAKPGEKGLELTWCYASGLFKPETIARMAASFETLMSAVVAYPNRSLQSLPLAGSEVCTELAALAQGPAASRTCVLVPDLIARQARARGDAPALLLED